MTFLIGKKQFETYPVKVDRKKLYGWAELIAEDDNGDQCELLSADESGKYIIPLGGTGMGMVSPDGKWVERSELVAVDMDGEPARSIPSSYSEPIQLGEKITPERFLDFSITDFYELADADIGMLKAVGDNIFTFNYTYNDSYTASPAFVMSSGKGKDAALFLMVGVENLFEMLCFGDCETLDDDIDENLVEDADNDLDFSMF